ncbi:MAG TPA: A/G-specific adenine glycosylase [Myxococcales bacterium]|nr:A/G-specific adenine glycosylase [Myxococcales bacterium]
MISTKLLAWFAKAKRDLPWREEPRDPYRVWISEVMLQQTRVEVVVPYYQRFLRRFPTLQALAQAPLDDVLALWSGLGYYARARNLHEAARAAGEALPRTCAELRELPGFGPYTAAAVASLAFNEDVPLVDGNVARVLARVHALRGDARARAWKIAAELLPAGRAGAFNEALMELGATVCTPRSPACPRCPIRTLCAVQVKGLDPGRFPAPRKKPARPLLEWDALALTRADGAVLLARRPAGALFAGLWDLPQATPAGVRIHGRTVGRGAVEQTLTHREVRVMVRSARASGTPESADVRWVLPGGLAALGISSLARKSLRQAGVLTGERPSTTLRAP